MSKVFDLGPVLAAAAQRVTLHDPDRARFRVFGAAFGSAGTAGDLAPRDIPYRNIPS